MATEIHQFTVVIPKNTTKAAPSKTNLALSFRVVEMIGLDVPFGPLGLMGFYIARAGQQIIPEESGEYFVWNDVEKEWSLSDYPTASGWQVIGYNLDPINDHKVIVRMHTNYPATNASNSPPIINIVSSPDMTSVVL